jgi:DDE superfamily endonuclease
VAEVPAPDRPRDASNRTLHLIVDTYARHKLPAVHKWLAKHQRYHIPFTPTSASWLNMVERFFCDILQKVMRANSRVSSKQNDALH